MIRRLTIPVSILMFGNSLFLSYLMIDCIIQNGVKSN